MVTRGVPTRATQQEISKRSATAAAWLYLMRAEHGIKVGITRTSPETRRLQVQMAAGLPIELVGAWECGERNPFLLEARVHERLSEHRGHGEWFSCPPEVAREEIEAVLGDSAEAWPRRETTMTGRRGRPRKSAPGVSLRDLRVERGMGLRELEAATGINRATWSLIEQGLLVPQPKHLDALEQVFNIPRPLWRIRFVLETEAS